MDRAALLILELGQASASTTSPSLSDTQQRWLVVFLVACTILWIRRQVKKADARRRFISLTHEEKADLNRNIVFMLYDRHDALTSASRLASATGVDNRLMHVALERLGKDGYIEAPEVQKEGGLKYDDWNRVRLTTKGLELYHQHQSRGDTYHMGDVVNVGNNSTFINRSIINGSINGSFAQIMDKYDAEGEQALRQLIRVIKDSQDMAAMENLDLFLQELAADNPKKGALRSLFEGMQRSVPTLSSMLDIVSKIDELIR